MRNQIITGPIQRVIVSPLDAKTGDSHAPEANTAAEVNYAAEQGALHQISGVAWSYDADPTGGNLKIHDGNNHIFFEVDITTGGPGFIPFDPIKQGDKGQPLVITLTAGGAGILGKVNALGHETIDG